MAGTVKAEVTQLSQTGRRIQEISVEARSIADSIGTVFAALKGPGWSGQAADAAERVVGAQLQKARQLVQLLDTYGGATLQGTNNMMGQEEAAAASMRSLPGVGGSAPGAGLSAALNSPSTR